MDAIVIGAGLSGLACARRLVHGGLTVTLIEARNRVGGRVHTLHDSGVPIDLAAEWVGNTGIVHSLLTDAGATVTESDGRYLKRTADGFANAWDAGEDPHPILNRVIALSGADRSFRTALNELGVGDVDARAALRYVEGFHAADPQEVGIRWLADVETNQSAAESSFRCEQGADRVVSALGEHIGTLCDVLLETAARAVRWSPDGAEVDTDSPNGAITMKARSAVITVPLPLLAQIPIDPPIPGRTEAASCVRMGDVAKVVLRMRSRFWESNPALENMVFLFAPSDEFPTIWTGSAGAAVLNVWSGGPRASRLCALSDAEVVARAIACVALALGVERAEVERHLAGAHFHNWTRDEFSRGAYTYVGVGGVDAHAVLARPVGGALYFAGEATIGGGFNATMEGAVRSGIRAAEELLADRR